MEDLLANEATAVKLTETPEFKSAVVAAAAQVVAEVRASMRDELLVELRALQGASGKVEDASDKNWVSSLAMEISQLTDQGTGRRRVPPDVLKARADARDRMVKAILKARAEGEVPVYRVIAKTQLDNMLVDPFWVARDHSVQPTEIDWPGIPNEAMQPINEPAKAIFKAFKDSIGTADYKRPEEALGVTLGGVVVHGRAVPSKRAVNGTGAPGIGAGFDADAREGDLRLHHKGESGQMVKTRVLGTIVPPAERRA
jgi:hypothetical protein